MDLRELRYFIAVAQAGSFSAAAQRLHIAQSALSRHIKALEEDVGGELFVRVARGVVPTEAGDILFGRAKRILEDVFATKQDLQTHHGELRGVASLVAPSSLSEILFVPLANHFTRNFPKVQLRLSEGLSPDALERVSHGDAEVAIITEPPTGDHWSLELLFHEQILLVAPKGTKKLRKSITLQQATRLPLITPSRVKWPKLLEAALSSPGALEPVIQVDSLVPVLQMVHNGSGYAVLPSSVLATQAIRDLHVCPVVDYSVTRWIAVSRGRPVSRASNELISAIRSEAKTLEARGLIRTPRGK
jgi:LysR family transcriptional regulator, nitrogen assimilation regulatory protein